MHAPRESYEHASREPNEHAPREPYEHASRELNKHAFLRSNTSYEHASMELYAVWDPSAPPARASASKPEVAVYLINFPGLWDF